MIIICYLVGINMKSKRRLRRTQEWLYNNWHMVQKSPTFPGRKMLGLLAKNLLEWEEWHGIFTPIEQLRESGWYLGYWSLLDG